MTKANILKLLEENRVFLTLGIFPGFNTKSRDLVDESVVKSTYRPCRKCKFGFLSHMAAHPLL